MIDSGWVKLSRDIVKSDLFKNKDAYIVYTYLLMKVSHRDTLIKVGNKHESIKAGSLVTSRIKITQDCMMTEQRVRSAIKYLIKSDKIEVISSRQNSVISVKKCHFQVPKNDEKINQRFNQRINQQNDTDINQRKNTVTKSETDKTHVLDNQRKTGELTNELTNDLTTIQEKSKSKILSINKHELELPCLSKKDLDDFDQKKISTKKSCN